MLNRPFLVTAVSASLLATLVSACGGSSSTPPAPQSGMGSGVYTPTTGGGLSPDAIHFQPAATLKVKPTKMTFTSKAQQQAQLVPNTDFYSQTNTCKKIVKKITYFDYGIYYLVPGAKKATCIVTFTDTVTKATAKMTVVNNS
jgi:hypothetical protein